jgi:serine protease AprX
MKKKYLIIWLFLLGPFVGQPLLAQTAANPRYLVLFKDKTGSPFNTQNPLAYLSERSIARRQRQAIPVTTQDLPVNPAYAAGVRQTGARLIATSRWFNGAVVEATDAQLAAIRNLPYFRGIERNLPLANLNGTATTGLARTTGTNPKLARTEAIDYGRMKDQLELLGIPSLHEKGLRGKGMLIAVFDAGFSRATQLGYLKHVFDEKRILDTYDFIGRDGDVYSDHFHGLNVLSVIAANQPGVLVGAAYEASFALYRTENELSESPYEEVSWLLAAERADSLGVDIINSSLGYNTFEREFNTPAYNYTYANMNGNTTIVSRAARHASRTGILVVNAAGNSGADAWRYITAPADVDSVLTVAATTLSRTIGPFSSIGPAANGIMKPDIAAVGVGTIVGNDLGAGSASSANGTSFATPQIVGLAALIMEEFPFLSAQQVIQVLKRAGHQAANPDNFLGYGVPTARRTEDIVQRDFAPLAVAPATLPASFLYPNPVTEELVLDQELSQQGTSPRYEVLSITGQVLMEVKPTDRSGLTLSVLQLPAGQYLLRVRTEEQVRTYRFVKH